MATLSKWRPNWPGTFVPRGYDGHAAPYDKTMADWVDAALDWIEENVNDARKRRTARSVVVHVPIYANDDDSMPDGTTLVDFSIRQMADMCGNSDKTIRRALDALMADGGPLVRVWTPPKGDRSMGCAYALRMPLSGRHSFFSGNRDRKDTTAESRFSFCRVSLAASVQCPVLRMIEDKIFDSQFLCQTCGIEHCAMMFLVW